MSKYNYAVFILTHGRPNQQHTYNFLINHGYTGPIYFVLDNEDSTIEDYIKNFSRDNVIIFDRKSYMKDLDFDIMDNFDGSNSIVYARNKLFGIAKSLQYEYFFEYEDDYVDFTSKYSSDGKHLSAYRVEDFDSLFDAMCEFMSECKNVTTIAWSQNGDWIGGIGCHLLAVGGVKRKAMNTFCCHVDRPFQFIGRMNDDVNAYTLFSHTQGKVFLTIKDISMKQKATQSAGSGNTGMYKKYGTYVKSFYSVIACPSAVKVCAMSTAHPRIHHSITYENCHPKIISDRFRK